VIAPVPTAGAIPATRPSNLLAISSAFLTPFSVNWGNTARMEMNITANIAMINSTMLRYVTVVHATWIPGLRLSEDTCPENLLNISESAPKKTVAQAK
jgi:hypothetical protein